MAIRQPTPSGRPAHPSVFHGKRMSREEYLALPEEKPYLEYLGGRVEQKPMVNAAHGRIVRKLDSLFDRYIDAHGGDAGPERRVAVPGTSDYALPDTAYWAPGVPSDDDSLPTLVVEVRSPSQRMPTLRAKCVSYVNAGVIECWLIDPQTRTLEVFAPGIPNRLLRPGEVVTPAAMPGFELQLTELFSLLDR